MLLESAHRTLGPGLLCHVRRADAERVPVGERTGAAAGCSSTRTGPRWHGPWGAA